MEVTFINVGYGDSILIQSQGFTLLLDGGSAMPSEFDGFVHRIRAADYLERIGISQIDLLIVSHIHEDHVCGLEEVFARIPVKEVRFPFSPALLEKRVDFSPDVSAQPSVHLFAEALAAGSRLIQEALRRNIPIGTLADGDVIALPGDLCLLVLSPVEGNRERFENRLRSVYTEENPTEMLTLLDRSANDSSLLLKLEGDNSALLLAGDSCPNNWTHLASSFFKNVNVLKLPHHGQRDSISESVMREMPLTHVITTASSDRRYHSANPAVYDALLRLHPGIHLLFTDEREYPPYFHNPAGACAIKLAIHSGKIQTEFIGYSQSYERLEGLV